MDINFSLPIYLVSLLFGVLWVIRVAWGMCLGRSLHSFMGVLCRGKIVGIFRKWADGHFGICTWFSPINSPHLHLRNTMWQKWSEYIQPMAMPLTRSPQKQPLGLSKQLVYRPDAFRSSSCQFILCSCNMIEWEIFFYWICHYFVVTVFSSNFTSLIEWSAIEDSASKTVHIL